MALLYTLLSVLTITETWCVTTEEHRAIHCKCESH
uniref:Uncharacterized protein n=1 Tax=Anguilla anguilla TaxID=7936 RepID=A0A0E9PXQ4_ANGAN